MAQSAALTAKLTAVDNISPALKNINFASKATRKSLMDLSKSMGNIMNSLSRIGLLGGGAAGIGGLAMAKGVINVSAQFEKLSTILEVMEGSGAKAKAAMAWVKQFAKETPYEVGEVADAFVRLRGMGIDPMKGALAAAGNAAAARGFPLANAVEAMGDAMTGENERLKAFMITSRQMADKVAFLWTENGKTVGAKALRNNQAMIANTLAGIWNRRYPGAMQKLSKTWEGVTSSLSDHWTNFLSMIGDAGSFDYMKGQMTSLKDTLDEMEKSGSLKMIAGKISTLLVGVLKRLEGWLKNFDPNKFLDSLDLMMTSIGNLSRTVLENKPLMIGLFAIFSAGTVASILTVGTAFLGLASALIKVGVLLLGNPISLAIIAIGAAGFLLLKNWDTIKAGLIRTWEDTRDAATSILTAIKQGFVDLWNAPRLAAEEFFVWMDGKLESMRGVAERVRMFINPDYRPASLPADITALADKYAGRYEIPSELVRRLIQAESGGNPRALSPKGAMGLMQLMPETAKRYGVLNAFEPAQNIAGGTAYLSYLLDRYKGRQALALAAYNAGEGNVDKYGGVPPFRETQDYVDKILGAGRRNINGDDIRAIVKEIQRGELLIKFDNAPNGMRVEPPRKTGGLNVVPDVGYRSLGNGLF